IESGPVRGVSSLKAHAVPAPPRATSTNRVAIAKRFISSPLSLDLRYDEDGLQGRCPTSGSPFAGAHREQVRVTSAFTRLDHPDDVMPSRVGGRRAATSRA